MEPYLWIVVLGGILGFLYACGIGANDVANAFASTVASKSLTLGQAVIAASIFEFGGAFFLGAAVTGTVRNSIFDVKLYKGEEDILLLGMFTSLIAATSMLYVATYMALPVSTTHTIVGCIMGFSIAAKGFSSINGDVATKIFISWIASPGVSGIVSFLMFSAIRIFIMQTDNPYTRAYYSFPLILTIFVGIDIFYVLEKGLAGFSWQKDIKLYMSLPASFGAGLLCGIIWLVIIGPIARRQVEAKFAREAHDAEMKAAAVAEKEAKLTNGDDEEVDCDVLPEDDVSKSKLAKSSSPDEEAPAADGEPVETEAPQEQAKKSFMERLQSAHSSFAAATYGQDLHEQSMHEDEVAEQLWDDAVHYDAPSEQMFTYVQVFTACLNSFAHGANDIANAIAPVSAIYLIYETGELNSKAPVQKWVLAYGGLGLVIGLLVYGYKVMKSLGFKLTALSPSRGASAELAASLTVVTASYMGIPISSTQAIVGAITGVGLGNGFKSVSWWFFAKVCAGWVIVFFTSVLLSMGVFCFVAFSPSLVTQ